jgi:hypothetical protein
MGAFEALMFVLALLFSDGNVVVLGGPYPAAQCAVAVIDSPAPPAGARLVCMALSPTEVGA